jgi:predicted esterase
LRFTSARVGFLILAIIGVGATAYGSSSVPSNDFRSHWANELVRLQTWPAQAERDGDTITFCGESLSTCQMRYSSTQDSELPPVLYLLDRPRDDQFTAGDTQYWGALEVADLLDVLGTRITPDPQQQPFHRAVLTAVRALDLLTGNRRPSRRAGLVGDGRGATLALAVAALRPQDVAFVCALSPTDPAQAYVKAEDFAACVAAPTLIGVGESDPRGRTEVAQRLYEALPCRKELVSLPRVRQSHSLRQWTATWQEWTGEALGYR